MNDAEYEMKRGLIAQAETAVNELQAKQREYIDKAKEYNALTTSCRSQISAIEKEIAPVRAECAVYAAEQRRLLAEKMQAEAEAKAKAREEAKAKEQSEVETLKAQLAEANAKLEAAKG